MENNRRKFILSAGALTSAAALGGAFYPSKLKAQTETDFQKSGSLTKHLLPELPYKYDALQPVLDKETVTIHHDRHHAGYIRALNKAELELAKIRESNDYTYSDYWAQKAAFAGAGVFLHNLYWDSMTPNGRKKPRGKIADKINEDFGDFIYFKAQFTSIASSVEGSGWAILGIRPYDKRLLIFQVENHEKLVPQNIIPLLCIDVWEHAYYLQYQNKRGEYIDEWWGLVNWENVEKLYTKVLETR